MNFTVLSNYNRNFCNLIIGEKFHVLNHNVHVVGFGKAVSGMYSKVYEMIGDHIVNGVLSVPVSLQDDLNKSGKQ